MLAKEGGERLGLESTLQLTGALRNAAMTAAGADVPEWLSGHAQDGTPTKKPHVAFFPLPYVDAEHADGHVLGLAMAVPRGVERQPDFRRILGGLLFDENGDDKVVHLWRSAKKGAAGELVWRWQLTRTSKHDARVALRMERWTRASKIWASVTPVVLHHYPRKNREEDVVGIVEDAFASAEFPKPKKVMVGPVSYFLGAGHSREMPEFTEGGERMCRYQTHVVVEFDEPVEGPVLVGRGRFRGYGLCRPVRSEGDERSDDE